MTHTAHLRHLTRVSTALFGAVLLLVPLAGWEHVARTSGGVDGPGRWALTAFAGAVLASAGFVLYTRRSSLFYEPIAPPGRGHAAAVAAVLFACAFVAFQPMLRMGLLSDDFALLDSARDMDFLPSGWSSLRPLPLVLWWFLDLAAPAGSTPRALHLLNVGLHALNAWLVWCVARRLGVSGLASFSAAALFLFSPVAVEPVVWSSGIFDVLLATLALVLCLVVSRGPEPGRRDQLLCLAIAVLMLATKETGVVAAPLALLVYWTRWGAGSRRVYATIGGMALVAGVYAASRQLAGRLDPRLTPAFDADLIERLVVQSVGALSLPLHEQVIRTHQAAAIAAGLVVIILLATWTFRWRQAPHGARLALLAAAALLLTVAPTVRAFGVLADLQGSRYVYLGSAFWCVALGAALIDGWRSRAGRVAGACVAGVAIVGAVAAEQAHFAPWREARRTRDRALYQMGSIPANCARVYIAGVPDHVDGAYVLRNGLTQALASVGREHEIVRASAAPPECRLDLAQER
ncbi:MAG: hypothetical protein ABL993_07620 [Vicinamibacterales bacterium]